MRPNPINLEKEMIELRWLVEEWEEYRDGVLVKHKEPARLQYKSVTNGEWFDVPTEYE